MMALYEGILGVKRDYKGLRICPVFPKQWESAEITRAFRNAEYEIHIKNSKEFKEKEIWVDGMRIDGDLLPDYHRLQKTYRSGKSLFRAMKEIGEKLIYG